MELIHTPAQCQGSETPPGSRESEEEFHLMRLQLPVGLSEPVTQTVDSILDVLSMSHQPEVAQYITFVPVNVIDLQSIRHRAIERLPYYIVQAEEPSHNNHLMQLEPLTEISMSGSNRKY